MSYPNTPTRLHRYFVTILLVMGVLLTGLLISCGSNSGEDDPSSSAADAASGCNDTDSHADSDADTSSGEHEHEYTEKTVQPTCTESGYVLFSCSCGDSYKENETEPLGHTYGEWIVVTEATAEADGLRERSCSFAGKRIRRAFPSWQRVTFTAMSPP